MFSTWPTKQSPPVSYIVSLVPRVVGETAWELPRVQTVYGCNVQFVQVV